MAELGGQLKVKLAPSRDLIFESRRLGHILFESTPNPLRRAASRSR